MLELGKYSFGIGDRFGMQGLPQLRAIMEAGSKGIHITPVWNKSFREHRIIGSRPEDVRFEADNVCDQLDWKSDYFVDADHINLETVDAFIGSSDFFTLDIASYIGKHADIIDIDNFVSSMQYYSNKLIIPGILREMDTGNAFVREVALQYLYAIKMAAKTYKYIEKRKGRGNFITEISMDEVAVPQRPAELFFILAMLSSEGVPVQTIAPKFSGKFIKGIDYTGDVSVFSDEFEDDLLVIRYAISEFGLNPNLKISVHSGSDKFSIYPHIGELMQKHNTGIHIKTAGTTWLEEMTGLALSEGRALDFVKKVYCAALENIDYLCSPYADVIDINPDRLPTSNEVHKWNGRMLAGFIRHIPGNDVYNPDMRQLIHVGYSIAAQDIENFRGLIRENETIVAKCVYENIYQRHLKRLFNNL